MVQGQEFNLSPDHLAIFNMFIVTNLLYLNIKYIIPILKYIIPMQEQVKIKLHSLIIEIKELSIKIDALKRERELLLDKFKNVQLSDDKLNAII
jgi:hypothetical protein